MHTPAPKHRVWLNGLLAGLFALTAAAAPAQHGRAVLERADVAYAMPHEVRAHADHRAPVDGHREHRAGPACFACVIMAAPGLPAPSFAEAARVAMAVAADPDGRGALPRRSVAGAPQRARAPPSGGLA